MIIRPKGLSEWRRSLPRADLDSEPYRGDEGRVSSWRWLRTVSTAFAFVIPVAAYLWLISRYGVNSFFADQWSNLALIGHSYSGTLSMGVLWAQHGDHRMFFPNLIVLLLAYTTHFNMVFEEFLSAAMLMVATALLILTHRRRRPSVPWIYYLPIAVVMLSWVQAAWIGNNTLWGFQMAWYLVLLALATSLYLLDSPSFNGFFLLGAIAAATVGSYSSLQGLLIWFAGLVVLYKRGRPLRSVLTWIACGIAVTALYFYNFTFGTEGASTTYLHGHLATAFKFFFLMLGDLVGVQIPNNLSVGDSAVLVLGAVILLIACWTLLVDGLGRDEVGTTPIEVALISFGLLFALITTIGRVQFGLSQAGESRYSTYDVLIVVGCYMAFLGRAEEGSRLGRATSNVRWSFDEKSTASQGLSAGLARSRRGLTSKPARLVVGATLTSIILLQATLGTNNGLAGARSWHQDGLALAYVTISIDKYPGASLYFPRQLVHIAKTHGLGLFGTSTAEFQREEDRVLPVTTVAVPRSGSVLKGEQRLVAEVSDVFGVSKVEFELSGGVLRNQMIATAADTAHGWLGAWNTTTVPNDSYTLRSVAWDSLGKQGVSRPVTIKVSN